MQKAVPTKRSAQPFAPISLSRASACRNHEFFNSLLKPYVPAKNFELSKQFYTALGFSMSVGWGDTADFELNGHAFRLQNYYVRDWAENFMFVIGVDELESWHRRATEMFSSDKYTGMSVQAPQTVDDSIVLHVGDPSGVLLVFVQ